jgi:hypothetical protein
MLRRLTGSIWVLSMLESQDVQPHPRNSAFTKLTSTALSNSTIPIQIIRIAEISLIASIINVTGTGAKISITLFQIASALGSAGYDVQFVAADISALSMVVTTLSKTLRAKRASEDEGEQIAGAVVCSVEPSLKIVKSSWQYYRTFLLSLKPSSFEH